MKKVILVLLTLCIMISGYGRTKVKHGSFEILENERYCGLTMDFSKAKFDGRSLETQLRSEDMSAEEWKAIENTCCIMIAKAHAHRTREKLTLLPKEAKKTHYYIVIQPLEIDLNDGECEVDVLLKDADTDELIAIGTGDAKASDTSFWEYNLLQSMVSVGKDAMNGLLDF